MVPLSSLWLPILLSAVLVFVASAIIHMVLPIHRGDWRKVPREGEVMDALRGFDIPPGDFMIPCGESAASMRDPEFLDKMKKGPVALITVMPAGLPSMGKNLAAWFIYCVVVGVFAAYVAGRALAAGSSYLDVFRFAGTTAFAGYALAHWQATIWYKRAWTTTLKNTIDGLVYALLTAGTMGWLWPR